MQLDSGKKLRPIAYTIQAEPSILQSLITVVWSLRHFKDLIYGYPIHVKTDKAVVVEVFNSKRLTGKLTSSSLVVQDFNPSFSCLSGKVNVEADTLWRPTGTLQISEGEDFK